MNAVRAFAPGTVANVGPGLDVLGLALTGAGDTVSVERVPGGGITIRSSGHPEIPSDVSRNTAGIAAYFEGYPSIHAVVDYDLLFTGPLPAPWSVVRARTMAAR